MKNISGKTKTAIIAIVLLMASLPLMADKQVQAQLATQQPVSGPLQPGVIPNTTVTSAAYLSFRPNPIGVGQTLLVNMWITPAPEAMRMFLDLEVTITKPDGTTDIVKMNSYTDDGTAWLEYMVDQVGTWKFKFEFPGTFYPAGRYNNGYIVTNSTGTLYPGTNYYAPASTPEQTLTVQQDIVASWPAAPLPTDYWTRPISSENREWYVIGGAYPWYGPGGGSTWDKLYPNTNTYWSASYTFIPWVQGPTSAHVLWKRQGGFGGIIGGDNGQSSYTSGGGNPTIAFQGRCYQTLTKPMTTMINGTVRTQSVSVWQCYDLRTGQVYWEQTDVVAPTAIEYTKASAGPVAGSEYGVSASSSLVTISNGRLIKYDPYTGAIGTNVSIAPLTSGTYYMNGYALSMQTINATASQYRIINWTTTGTDSNFTNRIISNTSTSFSLSADTEWDFNGGVAIWTRTARVASARVGTAITAVSLKTGQVLWDLVIPEYQYNPNCNLIDHGKLAVLTAVGYYVFYDEYSGKFLMKSDTFPYPWDEPGFGAYDSTSAYGMLFRQAYSAVYAVSWETGKIVWKYESPNNPFETPYTGTNDTGVSSWNGKMWVADGKLYVSNTEHTPSQPITRGWRLHCINATTGQGIWNITGSMTVGAIVDGYLTASNSYDGYMYVFGKGQSATTVSAPQTAITQGQSIVLTGTVLDQSPGQKGKACVSDDSMATYMEYLHMQEPIDGMYHNVTVTGVPVSIDAVDPNGNTVHFATVTSDVSGTFSYMWKPDMAGKYTVTATFMGDDSYGSSWAETAVGVIESPVVTPIPTQTPITMPPFELYTVGTGVAVIIAVAVATLLILRKRP